MKKVLIFLFVIFLGSCPAALLLSPPVEAQALYPVTVTDGYSRLTSDGVQVMIYLPGHTIEVPMEHIFAFTYMDEESALMNREDGHLFVLQIPTGAVFHLSGPSTKGTPAGPTPSPCPTDRCLK